jgi:hypothetical protein
LFVLRASFVGVILALILVTVPINYANAQDLNCDDFASQADAQRTLDRDSSDPNRLDANNDGIACGRSPQPSGTQVAVYLAVVLLAVAFVACAVSFWLRRSGGPSRATKGELVERLDALVNKLHSVQAELEDADNRLTLKRPVTAEVQAEIGRAKQLSTHTANDVDDVKQTLQKELSAFDKRTFRAAVVTSVITTIIGIAASILVNVYVP